MAPILNYLISSLADSSSSRSCIIQCRNCVGTSSSF